MSDAAVDANGESTPERALGERIRALRQGRRLTLRRLAEGAGTSAGFLSQLERGQVNASIGTLRKLAMGLGVTLPDLFGEQDLTQPRVLRRAECPEIHTSELVTKLLLSRTPLLNLEVYSAQFRPGGNAGEPYVHGDAQEMLIVLRGSLTLVLGDHEHMLDEGDSAEYRTSVPHTVRNESGGTAELLWIISPPTLGSA